MAYFSDFDQRTFAALAAIWERFFGPNAAALAAPPFSPPKASQRDSSGILWLDGGWSSLRRFADGFQENAMRKFIRIAGACF